MGICYFLFICQFLIALYLSKFVFFFSYQLSLVYFIVYYKIRKIEYEDGFFNELLVKQDTMLRELAIRECEKESSSILERKRLNLEIQENKSPNWCLNPKQPIIIHASLLSISTGNIILSLLCFAQSFNNIL